MAAKQAPGIYAPDGSLYITLTDGNGTLATAGGSSGITVGTTTITSGTNTRVLFNDSGVVGEDSGLTFIKATDALAVAGSVAIGGATIGTNALAVTGTAAVSGVTTALALTTSGNAAGVGGVNVVVSGVTGVILQSATSPAPGNSGVMLASGAPVSWASTQNAAGTLDVFLHRDAANTLALRNGTNLQRLNVYATYTDASNYELGSISFTGSNVLSIGTASAGTGSARNMLVGTNAVGGAGAPNNGALLLQGDRVDFYTTSGVGNLAWRMSNAGHFIAPTDNTYDIGASGATRPRNFYLAGLFTTAGSISLASNSQVYWAGRSVFESPADGNILFKNQAQTSFGLLQFGGTTSSFPALKRSTTILQARLADDSAFAPLQGSLRTAANATTGLTAGVLAATTNATIVITDASGQDYRVPVII